MPISRKRIDVNNWLSIFGTAEINNKVMKIKHIPNTIRKHVQAIGKSLSLI